MGTLVPKADGTYNKRQDRQRLLPRHHRIINLALVGHSNKAIGLMVGMDPKSVGLILNAPLTQAEMKRRRERGSFETTILDLDRNAILGKARSILESNAENAADTVVGLTNSNNENVQLKAALSILDRVFPKEAGANNSGPVVNVELNGEQSNLLVIAIKESQNGQDLEPPANSTSANTTQDECSNVEETPESRSLSA